MSFEGTHLPQIPADLLGSATGMKDSLEKKHGLKCKNSKMCLRDKWVHEIVGADSVYNEEGAFPCKGRRR